MSGASYPRDRIESVLLKATFPDCYRIVPGRYRASPLGTIPADSRFCSRNAGYSVLYAAPDFATAFIETVVRDRFVRRPERVVAVREITERCWARVSARPGEVLALLDLRSDGCTRMGRRAMRFTPGTMQRDAPLRRAIHSGHADIDGLVHVPRLTGGDVYAVFDRGAGKLEAVETGTLAEHPDLPAVLERHAIGLVR